MADPDKKAKITVTKDGPYVVTGNVPLSEKSIVPIGKEYILRNGRDYPHGEEYALCRCGKSKNHPFCDGSHGSEGFVGIETASTDTYKRRAEVIRGPGMTLMDDGRCAVARFCHRKNGTAWSLAINSDDPGNRDEAIIAARECPAGRLTAIENDGRVVETEFEQSIVVLQDPENRVSAGLFVRGGIPVESADGERYEVRNRMALCRCGRSRNKPFCDGSHIPAKFTDKR